MEKLMKPAEYAKELGISRQAVYAKIKKGILTSKNVEGKLYIVVDKVHKKEVASPKETKSSPTVASSKDYKALLQAKDETIEVLKETVVDLKESNKQISTTLRGEIDLLKDAFHEMRTLYTHQLEHKNVAQDNDAIDVHTEEVEKWIGFKKFFKQHKIKKDKDKIIKRFKKAYKKGDERFMMIEDKLKLNANKTYEDIVR